MKCGMSKWTRLLSNGQSIQHSTIYEIYVGNQNPPPTHKSVIHNHNGQNPINNITESVSEEVPVAT